MEATADEHPAMPEKPFMSSIADRKLSPRSTPPTPPTTKARFTYQTYNRTRQFVHLAVPSFLRWFLTAFLCVAIWVVLGVYSSKDALPQRKKKEFNTLIIAITIFLGLNIASSLKAHVGELRWWLLSLYSYSPKEADLILNADHLSQLVRLGWSTRRNFLRLFVGIVLLLNIASQIAIALLGITYNINAADKITVTKPGTVSITDFSDIQPGPHIAGTRQNLTAEQRLNAKRYFVNTEGLVGQTFTWANIETIPPPGTIYSSDSPQIFFTFDETPKVSYTYVFYEGAPVDPQIGYPTVGISVATNRTVTVSALCSSFHVVKGGDGSSRNFTAHDPDSKTNMEFTLPAANGNDQITYFHDPNSDANATWSRVYAFEAYKSDPWLYSCNVYIHPVVNAVVKEHYIAPEITRFIPPAIALQGYGASNAGSSSTDSPYQFQSYPSDSFYGVPMGGGKFLMSNQVSHFAANAILGLSLANSKINARGMAAEKGITLDINNWAYVHIILGLTLGVQFLVAVISVVLANSVQVRGHSKLAMAALLRPALSGVTDRADMATGSEIVSLMGADSRVRYSTSRNGGYVVRVDR